MFSSAGLFGGLLSVLMAGIASSDSYDKFSQGMDKDEKRWVRTFLAFPQIFLILASQKYFLLWVKEAQLVARLSVSFLLSLLLSLLLLWGDSSQVSVKLLVDFDNKVGLRRSTLRVSFQLYHNSR